jgi:hypothetical protein
MMPDRRTVGVLKRLMGVQPCGSRPDAITKRRMRRELNEYKPWGVQQRVPRSSFPALQLKFYSIMSQARGNALHRSACPDGFG